ncbi:hypothetical protein Leryth_018013 [Lithospermum erythrorhizon]|uniref:Uncharacterized protein n=1 Tax=Lithospermum erythrorhizon TaxID=34254 RepID=A0AAV3RTF8_LITER|nr:hypothetical protein Leryth_018013 [Lithospermum erythrorhizon]
MKSHCFLLPQTAFFLSLFVSLALSHKYHESSALHSQLKGYFSKVYAFGDSYTDTGNARSLGGLIAKSKNYPSKFGEPGSRLSDGRLVIDYLCEALSTPPLPPYKGASLKYSGGANFALAGSTALSGDYFLKGKLHPLIWRRTPISFQTQADWFRNFQQLKGCNRKNETKCIAEMESTLFWIGAMGVNDYTRTIGSSVPLHWLAERSVTHVYGLFKVLLESGAKYITIEGLPPVGCLPIAMAQSRNQNLDKMGCDANVNKAVTFHNQILQRWLEKFREMYPNSSILYADYWNAYLTILMNPKKYWFKEPFKACCGAGGKFNFNVRSICGSPGSSTCNNSSNHISWDGIHLTEAMNRHLVDMFLNQGFCQPSFQELIKSKSGI